MAPVKRSTTAAQRETRGTKAATVAKKRAVTTAKQTEPVVSKPVPAATRSTTSTRNRKKQTEEEPVEDAENENIEIQDAVSEETATITRTRATRSAAPKTGLAAAPRRRIKITPLDAHPSESVATKETKSSKARSKDATTTKKTSTRSKGLASITETSNEGAGEEVLEEAKTRSTRKTSSKKSTEKDSSKAATSQPKTRGRPKKTVEPEQPKEEIPEATTKTRPTRSQRVGSVASSDLQTSTTENTATKPPAGIRKKVTFQDLPSENDKENLPLPTKRGKKGAATKAAEPATGLRAKPLRKAAATTTATRGRRGVLTTGEATNADNSVHPVKRMPTALTPKKITQVAKSSSPEHETEVSDGEDELNGSKTPIRDLSVSPRRPLSAALARTLSPAKKLDFGQSFVANSPDKTAVFRDSESEPAGMLASPARRPAASPFKDAMKESPKRGLSEGAKLLFPPQSTTTTLVASTANSATQAMTSMLQSPKRVGILDPNFFSQSAMKKSAQKSPFKSSLFGTPAKRLFSPAKKSATSIMQKVVESDAEEETEVDEDAMELEEEVAASSHFRSSVSPLRVMRVDPDAADLDFDDSVLQIRSPLKVQKSPLKTASQPEVEVAEGEANTVSSKDNIHNSDAIEPATLHLAEDVSSDNDAQAEDHDSTVDVVEDTAEERSQEQSTRPEQPDLDRRPSLPNVLFRANNADDQESSSEDELARDETPARPYVRSRPSMAGSQARSRLSTGVPQSVSGKGFGFTPLAAQISGWLASSPDKSPEQRQHIGAMGQISEFSPLAREHIDGEVMISRDSTPVQKLKLRKSLQSLSSSKPAANSRKSTGLRQSMAQRQSMGAFSSLDSPARNPQFEEYMEIRAMEEQANLDDANEQFDANDNQDFDDIMAVDESESEAGDDTILANEDAASDDSVLKEAGDLTTDLINFTHASDTAMVDFQKLAEEAEELASDPIEPDTIVEAPIDISIQQPIVPEDSESYYEDAETSEFVETLPPVVLVLPEEAETAADVSDEDAHEVHAPVLEPVRSSLSSPSMLVIDRSSSPAASPSSAVHSPAASPAVTGLLRTPQPNLRINERRVINTVVSKVPLKPEGSTSPIKMPRKRSRSFGDSDASPAKRISFENLKSVVIEESPNRRVRTSVAPSPGGTSTPATNKSNASRASRYSLGAVSTPGQMSFAIDDFGDSTLDGIELPDELMDETELYPGDESPARSVLSAATTPKAGLVRTPGTTKRSARASMTSSPKKTPKTVQKTPARASTGTVPERTPLGPVGKGILHGATVFVDVHTAEGADASIIFIELLTQMGAKCVREWRWNPRASLAADAQESESRVGITHVVYKDGGKRTLEKVRDAKGDVCCVGVTWVLDCERENKWLDESPYTINTNVLPRGGSNRRKSMEPRALLVGNDGIISASSRKARRSVSAEMNEAAKRDLLNTPITTIRSQKRPADDEDDSDSDDEPQATPTGFVNYDPSAMTPGTPYLVSQGKKLVQMSAPPKQVGRSLFDNEDQENEIEDGFGGAAGVGVGGDEAVRDAKKFKMKNLGEIAGRRRTLGFKPVVGSPLGR